MTSVIRFLKSVLLKIGIGVFRLNANERLYYLVNLINSNLVATELIRVGNIHDGGYLVPKIVNDLDYCFSPGVSDSVGFEKQLDDEYAIKSFMIDGSIEKLNEVRDSFNFQSLFLGVRTTKSHITLSDWINQSLGDDDFKGLLQMDIEGSEYEVLTFESSDTLNKFSVMVVEFHSLSRLFDPEFIATFTAIFEKILINFSICHMHPNNCCGLTSFKGITVPNVLEITFIRNDLIDNKFKDKRKLPHKLDSRNITNMPDIIMPKIWWK